MLTGQPGTSGGERNGAPDDCEYGLDGLVEEEPSDVFGRLSEDDRATGDVSVLESGTGT